MRNVFMTAAEAREGAINNQLIYNEIRSIEGQIITAVSSGKYTVSINNTYMTSSAPVGTYGYGTGANYFRVWKCLDCGVDTDYDKEALKIQMDTVIKHFKDLGYSIERRITSNKDTEFYWKIQW